MTNYETQTEIIESIKQQHPDLSITAIVNLTDNTPFLIKVVSADPTIPFKQKHYLLLTVTTDYDNSFRWIVSDIDQKLVIRYNSYYGPSRKKDEAVFGLIDKNDPHNLERCIRLAIKLFEQI